MIGYSWCPPCTSHHESDSLRNIAGINSKAQNISHYLIYTREKILIRGGTTRVSILEGLNIANLRYYHSPNPSFMFVKANLQQGRNVLGEVMNGNERTLTNLIEWLTEEFLKQLIILLVQRLPNSQIKYIMKGKRTNACAYYWRDDPPTHLSRSETKMCFTSRILQTKPKNERWAWQFPRFDWQIE